MTKKSSYFLTLLKETSTWRGVILLLTALGLTLTDDQQEAIITIGLTFSGLIGTFFPDTVDKQNDE